MKYIDGARSGGNGVAAYAQAMQELVSAQQVLLSDLNQRAVDYLRAITPTPDPPDLRLQKADGTHVQERGAKKLAEYVARGLQAASVEWARPPP